MPNFGNHGASNLPQPAQSPELAALTEIADIFIQQMGVVDKFNRLLEVLGRLGETDSATLRRPDRDERNLEIFASWGRNQVNGPVDLQEPTPALISVESYRASTAIVVNLGLSGADQPAVRMRPGLSSAFALPVKADGNILGILSFFHPIPPISPSPE